MGDIPTLQTGEHIVKERKAILLPEGRFIETEVSRIVRKALKNVPITVTFPSAEWSRGWSVQHEPMVEATVDGHKADDLNTLNETLKKKTWDLGTAKAFNEWSRGKTFTVHKSSFETSDSIYEAQEKTFSLPEFEWREHPYDPKHPEHVSLSVEKMLLPEDSPVEDLSPDTEDGNKLHLEYHVDEFYYNYIDGKGTAKVIYENDPQNPIIIPLKKRDGRNSVTATKILDKPGKIKIEVDITFWDFHNQWYFKTTETGNVQMRR